MFRKHRNIKSIVLFSLLIYVVYIYSREPQLEANWQQQFKVTPEVSMFGDEVEINNLRNFSYNQDRSIQLANYKTQTYNLSKLKDFWFGLSHFGKYGLAHSFVSFEFDDGQFLVISIEARLKKGQFYNPIAGIFRRYTKTVILATEQDVVGLRTHLRQEDVYLYIIKMSHLKMKTLLLNYLSLAQDLSNKAEFYNTLRDNCLTGLLAESRYMRTVTNWFDYRIVLPGYFDEFAYDIGLLDKQKSFAELRRQAFIDPNQTLLQSKAFSNDIRKTLKY